ncbi:MAG: AraC family transcriptional regulator [Cyclobacteriaceae bacterium]|nr:AraC family transcriptional regulator [Cyclobacteriaceae bacterium]
MNYQRIEPDEKLNPWVDCYWFAESTNAIREKKKIIPDGFPEIIFHYRDPYRINISGAWKQQGKNLLAGQIRNFFYLENTGASGMVGIKFKPAVLAQLFELNMSDYTNQVIPLPRITRKAFAGTIESMSDPLKPLEFAKLLDHELGLIVPLRNGEAQKIERALDLIFECNGNIEVNELLDQLAITERQLQRLFNKYVGLPPKFYCRIIRFSRIFSLMEQNDSSWVEMALESGYYDQSHFIRNFKAFTGEDPSAYLFEEETLANFFMKRT